MYKYIQLQFSLKKGLPIAEQNIQQQFIFGKKYKNAFTVQGIEPRLPGWKSGMISSHIDIKDIGTEFTFNTEVCLDVQQAWPL